MLEFTRDLTTNGRLAVFSKSPSGVMHFARRTAYGASVNCVTNTARTAAMC